MILKLLLLLLYMCLQLVVQKAFADDPIVFKDFPASATCRRTSQQRMIERNTASTQNYRACYDYEIVNNKCVIRDLRVNDIYPDFTINSSNTTIFKLETPVLTTNVYPSNHVCFFVIGRRRNGYIYQYFQSTQNLEGLLNITNDSRVIGGQCQDFFEFREKQFDNQVPIDELVTCGSVTDPRIQFEVDVASALTLVFKSNGENEFQGVALYILEIDPSIYSSKRKKREIEAEQGFKGPIGDTGRQGAPGKQGPSGKPGRDGLNGTKGERGIPGIIGPEGDIGLPGEIGMPGDIGPIGPKGMSCGCTSFTNCKPGRPGRKGAKGSRGFRGDTGPRGSRGEPGKSGLTGFPGSNGEKGNRGLDGARGLPGHRGDQGPTGLRGRPGPPGPPGLGGCLLQSDNKLSRRIREVGRIFSATTELYDSLELENQMSADEFYDYIMKKKKDVVPNHFSDKNRIIRSTESSTNCSGILVIPGPIGDKGVPGLPGDDGIKGEAGSSGIDGTSGKPGEPGLPGALGSKGSRGDKGPKGPKGDNGNIGLQGDPGHCQCYQGQGETIMHSESMNGNGIPGRPGPRGPRGPKGFPGSVGEKGSPGSPGRRGPKGFKGDKGNSGGTGSNGEPGSKGQLGQHGIPGPTGPPGPPGPPGCVCNNLIILLDKYGFVRRNTVIPKLNIRPEGEITNQSTGFPFKSNITCIENKLGSAVIGPKGEQGLPGLPGAKGDPGIPGIPGRDGIPGIKGKRGDPGLSGVKGIKGLQGKMGKKGVTGLNGRRGEPGNNDECILGEISQDLITVECPTGCPNGLDGAIGDRGDIGPKGTSGPRGLIGMRGPIGLRGVAGLPGSPGDEGLVGKPGVKGPPGLRGLPGAVGPAGPAGPPGPRDDCPEYDGVDFDMFMSASKKDMEKIKYLVDASNKTVASEMATEEFPLLRELAKLIASGYRFTEPRRQVCQPLNAPANGNIYISINGTRAYFTCRPGFNIEGEDTLVCQNGQWNSPPPVCSQINFIAASITSYT